MVENWRTYKWPYEVSDQGRVRHAPSQRVRKLQPNKSTGYLSLNMWLDGRLVRCKVHLMVLETFVGPRPRGMQARHLNGALLDNRLENLRWGTAEENCADRTAHGRTMLGSRNHKAKLTEQQVLEIRSSPLACRALGAEYGVSAVMVSKIKRKVAWAWL